jgi:transposase-like protein
MTRRKRYSIEFKREALRRANEEGVTDTLVAEELGFSARLSTKGGFSEHRAMQKQTQL